MRKSRAGSWQSRVRARFRSSDSVCVGTGSRRLNWISHIPKSERTTGTEAGATEDILAGAAPASVPVLCARQTQPAPGPALRQKAYLFQGPRCAAVAKGHRGWYVSDTTT